MATPTLSTGLSRRTMLAGGVAVPAMALPVFRAVATLPEPTLLDLDLNADAELFRRIEVAEHLRNQHARMQRIRARLRASREARGDLMPLSFSDKHTETWLRCWETFQRYATAVHDAVSIPALTVAGIHAKLDLALVAARHGGVRVYMYEDREWLETTLTDLKRLADHERRLGTAACR